MTEESENRKALTFCPAHVCAIGEVARSDGGVKKQKNDSVKRFLHSSPAFCNAEYRGETEGTVVSEERGWERLQKFCLWGLTPPSFSTPSIFPYGNTAFLADIF